MALNLRIKRLKTKRQEYLQLYEGKDYLGQLSLKELCQLLEAKRAVGIKRLLAYVSFIKEGGALGDNGIDTIIALKERLFYKESNGK